MEIDPIEKNMNLPTDKNIPTKIHSDRLSVEIAQPGSVYTGPRFDWTGFITQVTLTTSGGNQHTFCVPESLEPGKGTGGRGICNEFGNDKAIGYTEAKPGETFPKLGIGLLRRPERPQYNFFFPHEIAQPFPIDTSVVENQAIFTVEPVECRGYAVRLTKTVNTRENWLEIVYRLENVGSQPINTNEYCHNFLRVDDHLIGPEYCLHFPYTIQLEDIARAYRHFLPLLARKLLPTYIQDKLLKRQAAPGNQAVQIQGADFNLKTTPQSPFYFRPLGFAKTDGYQWELSHLPSGVKIREYDDFAPCRVAVWGTTHVISAEIFVDINLPPNQEKTWSRRYEFLA
jgi:hypothetical protein